MTDATAPTTPFVVARNQIPLAGGKAEGIRSRPFGGHELMAHVGSSGAVLAWLEGRAGERVARRSHGEPTLLIVMRGRARLMGEQEHPVEQGDVLTMPGGQEYGFCDIESDLHVLQVALPAQAAQARPAEEFSLEKLVARNHERAQQVLESPFYVLLRKGLLDTTHKRSAACEAIRVFSDAFQTFLFTRQAMCREQGYSSTFHRHLMEELGHNELLQVPGNQRIFSDPILRATSAWFSHQMLTLDNAGKIVVNLALETSGYHFHSLAKPLFADGQYARYFDTHAEADEEHMDLGVELLAHQHPDVYRRLMEILDDSWDMMETVTTRFADLIDLECEESSYAAQ